MNKINKNLKLNLINLMNLVDQSISELIDQIMELFNSDLFES